MFMHLCNNFSGEIVRGCFTDSHSRAGHRRLLSDLRALTN
jgi:hypothetical protein